MKRNRIGAEGNNLALAVDLKVEMLAREIIMIVRVLVLQTVSLLIPSATLWFITFSSGEGLGRCANMNGGTGYIVLLVSAKSFEPYTN